MVNFADIDFLHMKYILLLLFAFSGTASAQSDKQVLKGLKKTIYFLADDKLEGRRTGTQGEKLAYEFISQKFAGNGLLPLGDSGYIQQFPVNDGKEVKEKKEDKDKNSKGSKSQEELDKAKAKAEKKARKNKPDGDDQPVQETKKKRLDDIEEEKTTP